MSVDKLERLECAHHELIAALDGDDIIEIEARLEGLSAAVAGVRAHGTWRDTPEIQAQARRISQLGEAVRVRVNFLTDRTRQRLQMLAAAGGRHEDKGYARPARMTCAR